MVIFYFYFYFYLYFVEAYKPDCNGICWKLLLLTWQRLMIRRRLLVWHWHVNVSRCGAVMAVLATVTVYADMVMTLDKSTTLPWETGTMVLICCYWYELAAMMAPILIIVNMLCWLHQVEGLMFVAKIKGERLLVCCGHCR